jgi:hypothetical protein
MTNNPVEEPTVELKESPFEDETIQQEMEHFLKEDTSRKEL